MGSVCLKVSIDLWSPSLTFPPKNINPLYYMMMNDNDVSTDFLPMDVDISLKTLEIFKNSEMQSQKQDLHSKTITGVEISCEGEKFWVKSVIMRENINKPHYAIASILSTEKTQDKVKVNNTVKLKILKIMEDDKEIEREYIITNINYFPNKKQILHLYHKSILLSFNNGFDVFLKEKPKDILKKIVGDVELDVKTLAINEKMDIIMQYNESKLNFFNRLCYEGCAYWIIDKGKIIVDSLKSLKKPAEIKIYDIIETNHGVNITKLKGYGHDPQNPESDLTTEVGEKETIYEVNSEDTKKDLMKLRLQYAEENTQTKRIVVVTNERLELFNEIDIKKSKYIIQSIETVMGMDLSIFPKFQQSQKTAAFEPTIWYLVIASNNCEQPQFIKPVARPQIAQLVTNQEKIIDLDDKKRMLVKFPFLKKPVPIIMPKYLGDSVLILPRYKEEIIVNFLNNDINLPIYAGSISTKNNEKRFESPEVGFKFKSWNDKTEEQEEGNNILWDNTKEKEKLDIQAQKDFNIKVIKGKFVMEIEEEDFNIELKKGKYSLKVKDKTSLELDDQLKISCKKFIIECEDLEVNAKNDIKFSCTNFKVNSKANIELNANAQVKASGQGGINLQTGANIQQDAGGGLTLNIGGSSTENVGGSKTANMGGAVTENIGGAVTRNIGGALNDTIGGAVNQTIGGAFNQTIGGVMNLTVGGVLNITVGAIMNITVAAMLNVTVAAMVNFVTGLVTFSGAALGSNQFM